MTMLILKQYFGFDREGVGKKTGGWVFKKVVIENNMGVLGD